MCSDHFVLVLGGKFGSGIGGLTKPAVRFAEAWIESFTFFMAWSTAAMTCGTQVGFISKCLQHLNHLVQNEYPETAQMWLYGPLQ